MTAPESEWPHSSSEHVALVGRISAWLERAGVQDPDHRATLAVGLGDTLRAARETAEALEYMLKEDPITTEGADRALTQSGIMSAWLFTEIQDHVSELAEVWETQLMERLAERLPPDVDGD